MPNNTEIPQGFATFDLYPYNPAQPPAYAYMAMFGLAGILHLVAMIPYGSWFPLPMTIGCAMQATAYYFRTQYHDDIRRTLPFLIQNLLLLASPPRLAASIYMSPRRLAIALESQHFLASPRLLGKLFILVDIICFITQVAETIMSGSEEANEAKNGRMAIIVAWAAALHKRILSAKFDAVMPNSVRWQRYMYGLYCITLLFFIRNITPLVEYNEGPDGEMMSKEIHLYLLDGSMMLMIVVVFLVLHPGRMKTKARQQAKKMTTEGGSPAEENLVSGEAVNDDPGVCRQYGALGHYQSQRPVDHTFVPYALSTLLERSTSSPRRGNGKSNGVTPNATYHRCNYRPLAYLPPCHC